MKKFLKPIAILVCTVALVAGTVAATLAYLKVETDPITNTFVAGDINITLEETKGASFKMIPGTDIEKDPTVTVKAGSEACWLFVKLDKSENFDTYLTYTIDEDVWTALPGVDGVYYRQVAAIAATADDISFSVLAGNVVTAKPEVTKTQYNNIGETPTLTVTAYAIQYAGFEVTGDAHPTAAWSEISGIS